MYFKQFLGCAAHCSGHHAASTYNTSSDLWVNAVARPLLPHTNSGKDYSVMNSVA